VSDYPTEFIAGLDELEAIVRRLAQMSAVHTKRCTKASIADQEYIAVAILVTRLVTAWLDVRPEVAGPLAGAIDAVRELRNEMVLTGSRH
jgi:hypothetical protein